MEDSILSSAERRQCRQPLSTKPGYRGTVVDDHPKRAAEAPVDPVESSEGICRFVFFLGGEDVVCE